MIAAAGVALVAGAVAARVALARLRAPVLPPPATGPPRVTVLLPVRDEEANVGACLAALLAQSAPVRVRVLDDGSSDRTREIAARAAAADRRVELLEVPPPVAGRSGKVNALAHGAAEGTTDWILAIDADARPAPDAIARALEAARLHGLGAVSLAARQRAVTLGEALLTPLVLGLLDAQLGDWSRAARGEGPPVANGQFVLLRAAALRAIGGYASIAGEPLDDVALARRLAAAGHRVGFWRAREALEVRMYPGFGASFRGWRRNLALLGGTLGAPAWLALAALLLPPTVAFSAALLREPSAALIAWLGGASASILLRAGTGSCPFYGLLAPLDGLALAGCLLAARTDRKEGRVESWRGRALEPGPDEEAQPPSGAE